MELGFLGSLLVLASSRPSLLIQFFLRLLRVVYFSSDGPKEACSFYRHSFTPFESAISGPSEFQPNLLSQFLEFQNFPDLSLSWLKSHIKSLRDSLLPLFSFFLPSSISAITLLTKLYFLLFVLVPSSHITVHKSFKIQGPRSSRCNAVG